MDAGRAHAGSPAERAAASQPTRRRGAWPALPAAAVLVFVLVRLAFDEGGYFPSAFTSAGAIAFIALAVLLAFPIRQRFSRNALVAMASLGALGCWIGLSRAWTVAPDTPLLDMQRAMLYLALFGLGLLAANSGRHARVLVWSVLGVVTVVAGAGLLSRLQPDLLHTAADPTVDITLGYRLDYPLEYWNAFGALASLGAVLAIGLAGDPRGSRSLRSGAAGASVILVVAMYLSFSRGAWMALIIGLVVLVAIAPNRGSLLLALVVAGVPATVAILRLRGYPALTVRPETGSGQAVQGDAFTRELFALVALAITAQALLAVVRLPSVLRRRRADVRWAFAAGAAIVVLGTLAGAAANGASVTAPARDAGAWIDRQWQDFLDPAAIPQPGAQRLLTTKGARSDPYRVALEGFKEHPIAGGGAGSFEVRYMHDRRIDLKLRDVHSLPLETLSEIGAVGFVLLLAFLGAVARAARAAVAGKGVLRAGEAAAVSAALRRLARAFVCGLGLDDAGADRHRLRARRDALSGAPAAQIHKPRRDGARMSAVYRTARARTTRQRTRLCCADDEAAAREIDEAAADLGQAGGARAHRRRGGNRAGRRHRRAVA